MPKNIIHADPSTSANYTKVISIEPIVLVSLIGGKYTGVFLETRYAVGYLVDVVEWHIRWCHKLWRVVPSVGGMTVSVAIGE